MIAVLALATILHVVNLHSIDASKHYITLHLTADIIIANITSRYKVHRKCTEQVQMQSRARFFYLSKVEYTHMHIMSKSLASNTI